MFHRHQGEVAAIRYNASLDLLKSSFQEKDKRRQDILAGAENLRNTYLNLKCVTQTHNNRQNFKQRIREKNTMTTVGMRDGVRSPNDPPTKPTKTEYQTSNQWATLPTQMKKSTTGKMESNRRPRKESCLFWESKHKELSKRLLKKFDNPGSRVNTTNQRQTTKYVVRKKTDAR